MGGGLFKVVGFVAPVVLVVIWLTFHQQQEHKAEMRMESAQFDREWNEAMAEMTGKQKTALKTYEDRAVAAQRRYSSEQIKFSVKRQRVDDITDPLDQSVRSFDDHVKSGKGGN